MAEAATPKQVHGVRRCPRERTLYHVARWVTGSGGASTDPRAGGARLAQGNYGDYAPVGEGVSELRLFFGPGYRVYFGEQGETVVVLLCGGHKASQARDIVQAQAYWREYQQREHVPHDPGGGGSVPPPHPDEIEDYLTVLFDEYAHDGNTAALLSSLRSVSRVVGVSRLAVSAGLSRKGLQKALSEDGHPRFASVTAILHALGYRLMPQKLDATPRP